MSHEASVRLDRESGDQQKVMTWQRLMKAGRLQGESDECGQ